MNEIPFVDYYEVFQSSQNANLDTIERLFRYLAKHYHPDVAVSGDIQKFTQLVEGFEVLRDPAQRAIYDAEYDRRRNENAKLVEDTGCLEGDSAQRHKILSLLYSRRRQNMTSPGVGDTTLEQLAGCPREILYFHLWYFREKGWIQREESGMLSITASGVDKIEENVQRQAQMNLPRLTASSDRLESTPVPQ
jgi:curved DNA-binding protein CbpA